MSYVEEIKEVEKNIKDKKYEIAQSKLLTMLQKAELQNIENPDSTYYSFENYTEELVFRKFYGYEKKVINSEYNIFKIYYYLGFINKNLKNYVLAINYFDKALSYNPINVSTLFERANVYRITKNLEIYRSEIEKTHKYIFNKKDLSRFYRELGNFFLEKKLLDVANALYTMSIGIFDTEINENALRYIAQIEHREVTYTPLEKIIQYFREYKIEFAFDFNIISCILNEYLKLHADKEKREENKKILRELSSRLMDMYASQGFIWLDTIRNEKYGMQINKPDHWNLVTSELYSQYGLKENTIFAFSYQETKLFSKKKLFVVSFEGECDENKFNLKLNDIIENMKKDGIKISYESISEKNGTFIVEKRTKYGIKTQYQRYLMINNKLLKNWWDVPDYNDDFNHRIAYELIKSLKEIDANEITKDETNLDTKV